MDVVIILQVLVRQLPQLLGGKRDRFLATGAWRRAVLQRHFELAAELFLLRAQNSARVYRVFLRLAAFDAGSLRVRHGHITTVSAHTVQIAAVFLGRCCHQARR